MIELWPEALFNLSDINELHSCALLRTKAINRTNLAPDCITADQQATLLKWLRHCCDSVIMVLNIFRVELRNHVAWSGSTRFLVQTIQALYTVLINHCGCIRD